MLVAPSDTLDQVAPLPKLAYRSAAELQIREAVTEWGRPRWPAARLVHELVMDRGKVRADMAFVEPANLVSLEIKGPSDTVDRLIHQLAMFRLASPETWLVADDRHVRDAKLMHYLLPTIGLAFARPEQRNNMAGRYVVEVAHEPRPFVPHPEALLALLWVPELQEEATTARVWQGKPGTHAALLRAMLKLGPDEQLRAVCRQLRRRNALWRADEAIYDPHS